MALKMTANDFQHEIPMGVTDLKKRGLTEEQFQKLSGARAILQGKAFASVDVKDGAKSLQEYLKLPG